VAAVPDVDLEAHFERSLDDGVHVAVPVDEAAGVPGERMGENVAGPQKGLQCAR
jgi:hypothetical protein